MIVGGEGTGDLAAGGGTIKASVLEVDGTLYFTMPDNAWAVDARDGRELWHYFWKTQGGTHIGNRGLGMWHDYLYMETPDDYLVSLDAKTGKERWHKTDRRSRPGLLLDAGARSSSAIMCSSAPATISTRRASCSRSIPRPATCSGSSTPCR